MGKDDTADNDNVSDHMMTKVVKAATSAVWATIIAVEYSILLLSRLTTSLWNLTTLVPLLLCLVD